MKKLIPVLMILFFLISSGFTQDPSTLFFNGGIPDGMAVWAWGYSDNDAVQTPAPSIGYSPGSPAIKWETYNQLGWQGVFFYIESYEGIDMSSVWETDSVYFKLRAPVGLNESDPPLNVLLYDSRNTDVWDYSTVYQLDNFQDLNDTEWHQFSIALKDFEKYWLGMDSTDVIAVSFEYLDGGVASTFFIDEVWIGNPDVSHTMTFFNGQTLGSQVWFEAWGFQNNELTLAEGEGYVEGTPAIVWETSDWDWQGMGFIMNTHDMTYSFTVDTISLKIKAPAGINDLALEWYDVYYGIDYLYPVARKVLNDVTWDGTWKEIKVPLSDFTIDGGFDLTKIYEFGIVAADATIPEKLLIDDIWLGDPGIVIDNDPPPVPENIIADVSNDYYNLISWDDIATESGETYDVYGSREPIQDLKSEGVFVVASDVSETDDPPVHNIYFPLEDGDVAFYYAVNCTDAAGNPSAGFDTDGPFTNVGEKRAVISLEESFNFVADGDLSEFLHIMPFTVIPGLGNWSGGSTETFDGPDDYTALCYVAMDDTTLYVAFDVIDDVFSWTAGNTSDWWEDESIEFYFGLYDMGTPHSWYQRGEEPDYRLVFRPDRLSYYNGDEPTLYAEGTDNYYFKPVGSQDYLIEARIPLKSILADEDTVFTPIEGYTIPFEIFCADADVANSGDVARVQFGENPALNPWGEGPEVWTFAWIGVPDLTAIGEGDPVVVNAYHLGNNYPNPFNPTTTIEYSLANAGHVELIVYNTLGQKVATLANERNSAGHHQVTFDASGFSSGVYFYKIVSKDFNQVKKMLLVK
jgi:hypothetical protein